MHQLSPTSSPSRWLFCIPILFLIGSPARAERLPIRTYTTADGLLRDNASCIVQDSRGFLWFCTSDGLSRFDGYEFTNYTTDDGLPHRVVNAFLETRQGVYWVGTNDGIARFDPNGQHSPSTGNIALFTTYRPEKNKNSKIINVLFEDRQGKLWCGTDDGLFWLEEQGGKAVFHLFD
ncbi:MAG TPA: two-component regulator propeller domain-containing protein, partial [Pyrinomonadaceae bacterium]|nr:two-component regulator propeller domain-containing protein [Pyrinomonadaceae bacterium]